MPTGEIGICFCLSHRCNPAFDADLAAQRFPMEQQRDLRIGGQFTALAAMAVGVKHEAIGTVAFKQHHAHRRRAIRRCRGQSHGVAVIQLALPCFAIPRFEQRKRIAVRDRIFSRVDVSHMPLLSCRASVARSGSLGRSAPKGKPPLAHGPCAS